MGIVKANDIEIWYDTFGRPKDRPLLLVMGGLCQGILWPDPFCQLLASRGFYVIRYDHRDTGLSSCFDFDQSPYDLLDMAKDGLALLSALKIEKAHIAGLSIGGVIAQMMGAHAKERVLSLTIISSTCDLRPSALAYEHASENFSLSKPKEFYLKWMEEFRENFPKEMERLLLERWRILNGQVAPFEEEFYRSIYHEFVKRQKHPESLLNHAYAIKRSLDLTLQTPKKVLVPTVVVQGSEDPVFQPDHGKALNRLIKGSRYVEVEGLGHVLNKQFYAPLADVIAGT